MDCKAFLLLVLALTGIQAAEPAPAAVPSPSGRKEKAEERFQAAFSLINASTDTQAIVKAMAVIREGFPASRPVLHENVRKGSLKQKCFALQVLGEVGKADQDLKVVTPALKDPRPRVRLAAVMAIRKLGKEGLQALLEYLPGEPEANNKKMAVKTLQHWQDKAALPDLVLLLKMEKDRGVQNFIVSALELMTRQRLGKDIAAWERYLESEAERAQALKLLQPKAEKKAGKP